MGARGESERQAQIPRCSAQHCLSERGQEVKKKVSQMDIMLEDTEG